MWCSPVLESLSAYISVYQCISVCISAYKCISVCISVNQCMIKLCILVLECYRFLCATMAGQQVCDYFGVICIDKSTICVHYWIALDVDVHLSAYLGGHLH